MSGFEHFEDELRNLDQEILRYAAICGVNLANRHEVAACLGAEHLSWAEDRARESLRGLLILRLKVEAEMIELGFSPAPLSLPAAPPESE